MIYIEFQVEEPSMETLLDNLLPNIVGGNASWRIINYRNKQRLLQNLPQRLRGYKRRLEQEEIMIFVLVDQDNNECHHLKRMLDGMAAEAGIESKTYPREDGSYNLVNRIVIQELEAWYFGDISTLRSLYPRPIFDSERVGSGGFAR